MLTKKIESLSVAVCELQAMLEDLNKKLAPICVPTPMAMKASTNDPKETMSPLASSLDEIQKRIEVAKNSVSVIMNDVQL